MEDILKLYAGRDNFKIAHYWILKNENLLKKEDYT
jgi:hypothetical protein